MYKLRFILKYMTPDTMAAWMGDIEDAASDNDATSADVNLMLDVMHEMLTLVGVEKTIELLGKYDINEKHPVFRSAIAQYKSRLAS